MANIVIQTTPVRVSFPHLDAPYVNSKSPQNKPKYGMSMLFPASGVCPINGQPSSPDAILQALEEVCMKEWGIGFNQATAAGMGIEHPPRFKDGNTVFVKDAAGNPQHGVVAPETAGMWILSAKNPDPVGTVDPTGTANISPASIYAGCWARCQLEVSAYTSKMGRVVAIKLLNVQMAYDDVAFGNRAPAQTAMQAFAGQAIADTNVAAGYGQGGAMTAMQTVAPQLGVQPQMPQLGVQPQMQPQMQPTACPVIMNQGLDYDAHIAIGHTPETLIAQKLAVPNYLNPTG